MGGCSWKQQENYSRLSQQLRTTTTTARDRATATTTTTAAEATTYAAGRWSSTSKIPILFLC